MHLPEAQRETVMLVFVEGYSYREAAALLEVPIGTIMSRLSNARQKLKAVMQHDAADVAQRSGQMKFSDETLMAYLEGSLDETQCRAIDAAVEDDAELERRMMALDPFAPVVQGVFEGLPAQAPQLDLPEAKVPVPSNSGSPLRLLAVCRIRGHSCCFQRHSGQHALPNWVGRNKRRSINLCTCPRRFHRWTAHPNLWMSNSLWLRNSWAAR